MANHISIKTIIVSTFFVFLAVFGCLQSTYAESLNSAYGFGSATTASTTLVNTNTSTTIDVSGASDVLVVSSFMMEMAPGAGILGRDAIYQITDGTNVSGTIGRRLQRIDGNDKGIGSLVYIFGTATTFSGNKIYSLQHSTSNAARAVTTTGSIVAIPLVTSNSNTPLLNASQRTTGPVNASNSFTQIDTPISITTPATAPGDFYVAASVETDKSGGGGADAMGEWKLQYSDNGGGSWNDIGYTVSRLISNTPDNGIVNLVALLPQQAANTTFNFRVAHRKDTTRSAAGSGTIQTENTNLVAVYTGFNDTSNDLFFPTYSANAPSSSTTNTALSESVGFDFLPRIDTDLFLHAQYWMEATGFSYSVFDLFVDNSIIDGLDQQRLVRDNTDAGSGASVGLAQGLVTGTTYRASLRYAVNPTGETVTVNNPYLIGIDLNTFDNSPTCPVQPPQTPTRTPGPDNCLYYDGIDNYVSVPDDNSLDLTSPFTIECWVKPDSLGTTQGIIGKGGTAGSQPSIRLNASDRVEVYWNGSLHLTSTTALPSTCQWYHIAATYANPALTIYINGISDGAFSFGTSPTSNASALSIGQSGDANYFNGAIDEVRIWDFAFGTTVLRDWMCKKVTYGDSGHPNWRFGTDNLSAYWRFDENGLGSTVYDEISYLFGTNNDGTATNFAFGTDRICSSAPIGDDSAHDYNGTTFSDFEVTLSYPPEYQFSTTHDEMTATGDGGTWSGLQLYRVDEAPNNNVPPFAWGTGYTLDPNRYWGVFADKVFSSSPTYQVVYDWTLHQGLTKESWNSLKLADRDGNCDMPWAPLSATLNTTTRTLTKTGLTGTEYILGGNINSADPLAITLARFFAEIDESGDCIRVAWKTATEIETIGYYLWRGDSESTEYTLIFDSFTPSEAVSETTGASYEYIDCTADLSRDVYYYYKLEEVDFDTEKSNPMYGPAGPVSRRVSSVKLSESFNSENDSKCFINTLLQ